MFAARDGTLAAVQGTEEVVLWFERDLYDQLQLIQILDRLGARRASLIDLGEPRRNGVLDVLALYERRVAVTGAASPSWAATRGELSRRPTRPTSSASSMPAPPTYRFSKLPSCASWRNSLPPAMGSHAPSGSCSTLGRARRQLGVGAVRADDCPRRAAVPRRRPVPPLRRASARRPRAAAHRARRGLRADGGRPGRARRRGRPRASERDRPLARGRPSPRRGSGVALGCGPEDGSCEPARSNGASVGEEA